jgi:hypothetical protein
LHHEWPNTASESVSAPAKASPPVMRSSRAARGISPEVIFSSLSNAVVVVTKPPVRAATSLAKVTRPIPEILFCGYSDAIRHVTCAEAGAPVSANTPAMIRAAHARLSVLNFAVTDRFKRKWVSLHADRCQMVGLCRRFRY